MTSQTRMTLNPVAALSIVFALFLLAGCEEEMAIPIPERGEVVLSAPLNRQKTYYLSVRYRCTTGQAEPTGDTIVLTVTNEGMQQYFEELGTPGSQSPEIRDHSVRYPVTNTDGALLMPDRSESRLFRFLGDEALQWNTDPRLTEVVQLDNCRITLQDSTDFQGDERAFIQNYRTDSVNYSNLFVVSPDMNSSMPGHMLYDSLHMYFAYDSSTTYRFEMEGWMRAAPN